VLLFTNNSRARLLPDRTGGQVVRLTRGFIVFRILAAVNGRYEVSEEPRADFTHRLPPLPPELPRLPLRVLGSSH